MKHLDLFSGIGGFALAASRVWSHHKVVAFCELDAFCQKVLRKHWPETPIISDIRDIYRFAHEYPACECCEEEPYCERHGEHFGECDCIGCSQWDDEYGPVDIITGGFPCQPFSVNGHRKGNGDTRSLWPEMFRVIRAIRPRWVVCENVTGFINVGLDDLCDDLEKEGYKVEEPFVLPACSVGADHRRDRIWIAAHDKGVRVQGVWSQGVEVAQPLDRSVLSVRDSNGQWKVEPDLCRTPDGVSGKLDKGVANRLKALGNSIVPQVAEEIFNCIKAYEEPF